MNILESLEHYSKKNHALVGIGIDGSGSFTSKEIIKTSIEHATRLGYAEVKPYVSAAELVGALKSGEIECAVRGNLSAKEVINKLRSVFKISSTCRAALICTDERHCFFLAPVGIDEGIFIDERLEFIKLIDPILQDLGVIPKFSIISGGRSGEDLGRSGIVDESLHAGEKLCALAKDAGFDVEHNGILIEDAYKSANAIIAPNGIVGNLLFRTLYFLGNCRSFGAPILNLDKVFIDTSRGKKDYTDAIMLGSALSG